ncbi:Uncharacterised protein [Mycobacteroides abscessus subsp. abscessus]|nr:Uncharacterised protein [Mycobacteroides abscessus subsp. abscessus]SHT77428.1 Uncharacterised protein [Mycobacteroides abscessus subsp. abscessus]SHW88930.1 Uncharacterised protein [Mycobacteroides abscessus subsp. abscessus]SIG26652.1 Uncharacterised protein [Mycobacteroides abscessus subsp. abscessus]SKD18068.1 Uncharacterised protein [Mycobacteroides abscessus subsp. abscessus]
MHIDSALAKGYLPKELPPCFFSTSFAATIGTITRPPGGKWTYPVRFSLNRAGGVRRSLEIPNPFSQYFIAEQCSLHWEKLRRITGRSEISLSRPLRGGTDRSLRYRSPIDRWGRELIARMPGGRVTLKTDISQFYPSIYTHAVDWSIRGKARAKRDLRGGGLGPNLDKLLRISRGGQTIGLSVGPDTSWLVAEVVLSNIDAALAKKFPGAVRRTARFGDDMTVYASSLGEADEILAVYQVLLLEYELAINPVKASIVDGLLPVEASWVRKLRAHRYRDDRDYNLTADVIDLFDVAFEERSQHPTQGVLSYAIKRCNPFPAGADSWPVYRDLVLASIGIESSTLPHAHAVLEFAHRHGLLVDKSRIAEILNELLVEHARLEHGFETSWILYMIRSLSLELDSTSGRAVSAMDDNCSLILLRDICDRSKRLMRDVSFDAAVTRAERSDALSSNDWLLAYEYRHNGWCRPKNWDRQVSWKELHRAGVHFFLKKGKPPGMVLRRRRPSFVASWLYGP